MSMRVDTHTYKLVQCGALKSAEGQTDRERERKCSNASVTDKNKLRHFYYLVGQDINVVSDISGLDLVSNTVPILLTLQTLGIGFLHYIHLMHKS